MPCEIKTFPSKISPYLVKPHKKVMCKIATVVIFRSAALPAKNAFKCYYAINIRHSGKSHPIPVNGFYNPLYISGHQTL